MEINKHIIDQRITKIVADNPAWFAKIGDEKQKKSKAFVIISVSAYLGVEMEEAKNLITEGGNDAGVDAIFIGDLNDFEFPVTIFQGKYVFDLDKDSNFPANSIQRVVGAIASIFDPYKPVLLNDDLKPKVQEIRSLISDGYIPTVRCICTNNGLTWTKEGDNHIENAGFPSNQVQFDHFNHDDIVQLLQNKKGVKATIHFSGKSIVDDFNYKRVLLGKVNVVEFAQLFESHGDVLLEKNIRRYPGLSKNRVNESIQNTLIGDKKDIALTGDVIPSSVVAESVFTIWKRKPHLAKFKRTELFGKFYDDVFKDLNSAQAVLAILIYRYCDNQRRKYELYEKHPHLPYSNYFIAMIIGDLILSDLNIKLPQLTHINFEKAKDYFEANREALFARANAALEDALKPFYPDGIQNIEPRRLSASFRRGELLEYIKIQ